MMKCIANQDQAIAELKRISNRTSGKGQEKFMHVVQTILQDVAEKGDEALKAYTKKFDGFVPEPLAIAPALLEKAWDSTSPNLKKALTIAYQRIKEFHSKQIPQDLLLKGQYGEKLVRRWRPVQKAGIYIPGGRAAYPSTVLMNAVPAQVAGVQELVMVSPAGANGQINPTVLAAAYLAGVKKVFRVGGAQSIAALAYGTETLPQVDVISGPGNIYVTLAKKAVYGQVGIDSLAGPSEVLIIADQTADLVHVATDLLAQAEHDPLAAAILLTTQPKLAELIPAELERQLKGHPREEICRASLKDWGLIAICSNLESCTQLSDGFAPEHLELLVESPDSLAEKINNAGAIFLGALTPEAVGDYLAGPNHTLPTSGSARFSGALGVETFMKNTSLINFNKKAFDKTAKAVEELAKSEGLHSHAQSIKIRSRQN